MANIKQALKRIKVTEKRTLRNTSAKSELKTTLKKSKQAIAEGNNPEALNSAYKALDQAVAANIIHKNNAARKKSQLAKAANKAVKA